ncbi:MAG: endonuclease III [Bacilli bacterium]|nr:endonuclease III [Bacilli bacterium]
MNKVLLIENYLDELYKNPKCELKYNKDYELLISIMLSARTTDKKVNEVTSVLYKKYNTLEKLKDASLEDIKSIIKPLGNYNKKSIYIKEIARILVDNYNSTIPLNRKVLESLNGIGRKTVNVFMAELNIEPSMAVDTHVFRVSKRLGLSNKEDNVLKVEERLKKVFKKKDWSKRHLQLVLFGRYNCKSLTPNCNDCKLKEVCNYYKNK